MKKTYLIKIGEIALKAGNRASFEKQLKQNILEKCKLPADYYGNNGRFYLTLDGYTDAEFSALLSSTFGITGFAPVIRCDKHMEKIKTEATTLVESILAKEPAKKTFKIESRRSDKGFTLSSYEIACVLGEHIKNAFPSLSVDCGSPDFTIHCEVREKTLLYGDTIPGPGGLPVGCAGKGTLLLSGGIDSPVAGYVMAKRGLKLNAVYFHTPPFTSEKSKEKVESLAETLAPYCSGLRLFTVPFTDVQLHIKQNSDPRETTLLMRACMMEIADIVKNKTKAKCLITGEALSQVASQTVESITFTGSSIESLVLRPLIGYDKEEIIKTARRIGTFPISILPYDDCCTIFAPKRPVLRPQLESIRKSYSRLNISGFLRDAAERAEHKDFSAYGNY